MRTARNGAAVLTTGLLLGVVPGLIGGDSAFAAAPNQSVVSLDAPTVVNAGQTFIVTAHLNQPFGSVTFYQSVAGQARQAIETDATDANGNVSISGSTSYTVTFTARHEDDGIFTAAEASRTTSVRQGLSLKTKGGKKKSGYRLYKVKKKATFSVTLAGKAGVTVKFRVQKLTHGKWKTLGTRNKATTGSGKAKLVFSSPTHKTTYRVRAEYAGDRINSANVSRYSVIAYK